MIVHEVEKGISEKIVFSLNSFKGESYLHIRIYFQAGGDEWRPTQKGISVSTELIEEIYQGVSKLRERVNGGN